MYGNLLQGNIMYGPYKQLGSSMASDKYVTTRLSLCCACILQINIVCQVILKERQALGLIQFLVFTSGCVVCLNPSVPYHIRLYV